MELEFKEHQLRCLRQSAADVASTEQTIELRLPENMPPIGRVLGAWGQCLLRGKDWQSDRVAVNGGVMVNALYESEDGSQLQCVEGWIPFQLAWELRDSHRDGTMIVSCLVREVDARQIGAEKLILRASVSAMMQALEEESYPWWEAPEKTEDVQLLKQELNLCVPSEAGERKFQIDEEIMPIPGHVEMERLLFGQLIPSVREAKVLDDKLVFRGVANYHVVYLGADGMLHVWDGDIPMSQFSQLGREYGENAQLWVDPAVTDLEFTTLENGRLSLKAGILGQYVVYDAPTISVVADAYCPNCAVELNRRQVMIPNVKAFHTEQRSFEQALPEAAVEIVDATSYMAQPRLGKGDGSVEGVTAALYYDADSCLRTAQLPLNQTFPLPAGNWLGWLPEMPQTVSASAANGLGVNTKAVIRLVDMDPEGVPMITGITLDAPEKTSDRPGLIIRRAGDMTLWELAKACGSTVLAIEEANALTGEPEKDQMLLIPVK